MGWGGGNNVVQTQNQRVKLKNACFSLPRANKRWCRTSRGLRWKKTPGRGGRCIVDGRRHLTPSPMTRCCKRSEQASERWSSLQSNHPPTIRARPTWTRQISPSDGLPFAVRVAVPLARVVQGKAGGDEAAAGALDGLGHRVAGLAPGAPLHPGDAELRLEEEVEVAVGQQQGRLQHPAKQTGWWLAVGRQNVWCSFQHTVTASKGGSCSTGTFGVVNQELLSTIFFF